MRGLWCRLADRVVPPGSLVGVGTVGWRIIERSRSDMIVAAGMMTVSAGLLGDAGWWRSPRGEWWKRWPALMDLFPMVSTTRGTIEYFRPPTVPQ